MRAWTFMLGLVLAAGSARAEEKGTYFGGVRQLGPRQYLDLDNGGIFSSAKPFPGGAAEVRQYKIIVPSAKDAAMADAAPRWSQSPWHRVPTNKGNTSWVQFLRPEGVTVLRFITRIGGKGGPLPAPTGTFCLGKGATIELHFDPSDKYVRYRIERRSHDEDEFKTLATVKAPPYLDARIDGASRYAYRIAGVTADGQMGIPVMLAGTVKSRGVLTGTARLDRGANKSFDFLRGIVVPDGDVTLTGTYGGRSSASFKDAFGQGVRTLNERGGHPLSAWDHVTSGSYQVRSDTTFLVPLKEGGVARCRVRLAGRQHNGPEVILEYEVYPDGGAFPQGPQILAKRADEGVRLIVKVPDGHRVTKVMVREILNDKGPWELEVKRGTAFDAKATDGEIRDYVAFATDEHGRRTLPGRARISLLSNRIAKGEFKFHYKQGYSIRLGRTVPEDQADVYFETCAGGISSITLSAPRGGITNLLRALGERHDDASPETLFDSIVSAQPGQLELKHKMGGDDRIPSSDVFILKTRHGGWAKLAITHRGNKGGWTRNLATVKFVYNPVEPVFEHNKGQGKLRNGIAMIGVKGAEERARILGGWREGWGRLWANAGRPVAAGGAIPDPAKRQEVLLSRRLHGSYETATFSFGHAVRDDPGMAKVRNDWDLLYDGKVFSVCTVTDDRSTIRDLGKTTWNDLQRLQDLKEPWELQTTPRFGHIYLIHTVDKDTNYFTLVRVSGIKPGDRVAFEWISLQPKGISTSPGMNPVPAFRQQVERLLRALPKTEADRKQAFAGREAEYATSKLLREREFAVGVQGETAAALLKALEKVCEVRIHFPARVNPPPVDIVHRKISAAAMLDEIARQTKLTWRIQQDGSIRFSQ